MERRKHPGSVRSGQRIGIAEPPNVVAKCSLACLGQEKRRWKNPCFGFEDLPLVLLPFSCVDLLPGLAPRAPGVARELGEGNASCFCNPPIKIFPSRSRSLNPPISSICFPIISDCCLICPF